MGPEGLVVSCDLLTMDPVPGAVILPGRDFTKADTWRQIRQGDILQKLVLYNCTVH